MADEYQIASGHNNAGSLVDITAIVPSGDVAYFAPKAWHLFTNGAVRVRANGAFLASGFKSTTWKFGAMTNAQYEYLRDNYYEDATNGNAVTIRTRGIDGAYANYNARILLPRRSEQRADKGHPNLYMEEVDVRFIRLEAL
jgi:hypothetical protein